MQEKRQNISPIKQRILQFVEYLNISKRGFYQIVGVSRGTLESNTGITEDVMAKFIAKYPEINIDWLVTGNGSMLKGDNSKIAKVYTSDSTNYDDIVSDFDVPLYDIDAAANLRTIFANKSQNIIDKIRIPQLPKCDGAVYVRGDSMYPLLKSGDIVVFKEIYNFQYITTGEMYLVDYSIDGDDYLVVKYIQRGDVEGKIKLISYNTHHQSMDIPVSAVRSLAIIKASIRLNTMI